MLRLLIAALLATTLAACGHQPVEPPSPATRKLLDLARKPVVAIDPADVPKPPKGYTRAEVRRLAEALASAAGRIGALDDRKDVDHRTAVDATFETLDMRTRVEFSRLLDRVSRDYRDMPLAWAVTDRFEHGSRPVGPARVVKAAWSARRDHGWLKVSLQVVRAHVTAAGEPMFVDRTFTLYSAGLVSEPIEIAMSASISGIDRCHVVETGLFRPERDQRRLARGAAAMERDLASAEVSPPDGGDFTAGC